MMVKVHTGGERSLHPRSSAQKILLPLWSLFPMLKVNADLLNLRVNLLRALVALTEVLCGNWALKMK